MHRAMQSRRLRADLSVLEVHASSDSFRHLRSRAFGSASIISPGAGPGTLTQLTTNRRTCPSESQQQSCCHPSTPPSAPSVLRQTHQPSSSLAFASLRPPLSSSRPHPSSSVPTRNRLATWAFGPYQTHVPSVHVAATNSNDGHDRLQPVQVLLVLAQGQAVDGPADVLPSDARAVGRRLRRVSE